MSYEKNHCFAAMVRKDKEAFCREMEQQTSEQRLGKLEMDYLEDNKEFRTRDGLFINEPLVSNDPIISFKKYAKQLEGKEWILNTIEMIEEEDLLEYFNADNYSVSKIVAGGIGREHEELLAQFLGDDILRFSLECPQCLTNYVLEDRFFSQYLKKKLRDLSLWFLSDVRDDPEVDIEAAKIFFDIFSNFTFGKEKIDIKVKKIFFEIVVDPKELLTSNNVTNKMIKDVIEKFSLYFTFFEQDYIKKNKNIFVDDLQDLLNTTSAQGSSDIKDITFNKEVGTFNNRFKKGLCSFYLNDKIVSFKTWGIDILHCLDEKEPEQFYEAINNIWQRLSLTENGSLLFINEVDYRKPRKEILVFLFIFSVHFSSDERLKILLNFKYYGQMLILNHKKEVN